MRIIRHNAVTNAVKLEPESFDDLYLLAMVIAPGDKVEAHSTRRFKASETDTGEQKDVFIKLEVEKIEIDKAAGRLRLIGTILEGRPQEFVTLNSHHTFNIAQGDIIDVFKEEWKDYIIRRLKEAQREARKPKLGIIVMDDEKALFSYIRGYGIDIVTEIYSKLSKRMKEKDYGMQRAAYFKDIVKTLENMTVDIIIVAGPGFTKDDLKKWISDFHVETKKRLVYAPASDAERSGIREVMRSQATSELLENEHVKREFEHLNQFLSGLRTGVSASGPAGVYRAIQESDPKVVMVNDSVINSKEIKKVLDLADSRGIRIEIFNSDDDAGIQLKNFKDIVAV